MNFLNRKLADYLLASFPLIPDTAERRGSCANKLDSHHSPPATSSASLLENQPEKSMQIEGALLGRIISVWLGKSKTIKIVYTNADTLSPEQTSA